MPSVQRRGIIVTFLLVVGALAGSSKVGAAEVTYQLALRSPHVWRGITLRRFPVLNASVTVRSRSGFAAQLWAGIDLSDDHGREGDIQEIDLDLSHTWKTDRTAFTLGYVELLFPGSSSVRRTGEMYARWGTKGLLSPELSVYYNVDLLRDVFLQLSLSHRWQLSRDWATSATATVGYAGEGYARFFDGSEGGLHHWGLNLDFDVNPKRCGVKLRLAYSETLDTKVLPDQPVSFWGGIYVSVLRR